MAELVNPYIAGAPVTEARMFFGREDVFQWIENSIAGQYVDHILVIHGQRRVGKTSVLKQLGNRLPGRYIPVFFDLQGRTHTTLDRFLWWLAREIVRVLKQDRGIEIYPPEKEAFSADTEYFENQFLTGLRSTLGNNTLLLTFDEFDNLEESEVKEELARPLVDHLRRLMGQTNLNFIFSIGSSGRKLENMQAAYTEFFKSALYKKISFLNEEQTHHLITRPVEGILEYDRGAVNSIFRITGGHPYFTQLTCHELFAGCQRTGGTHIKESDVESVLEDVVERGTVNLKFVWDEASDVEKWGLAALAQLDKTDNRTLIDYLKKQRVRFTESDLTSGLLHLREKDVLTRENRFVIQLLKLWLQKNRSIEQAREELTEVNPIASRLIEIGLEFREGAQHEKAIEYFRQALTVSSENIQAQVNIALVYMDQKAYDKAINEFERALAMDDEDVTARSGLCEAHLALGDAAMGKGRTKEAAQSYQRVLAINAEHTEARQRMAELSRQRAERTLTEGKEEGALSAFAEALKYTPEDPALIARVEQVRAEKKAKVFAALLERSEKEAGAKNWEGAVKSLEEALPLAPDDASIQEKLIELKAAQEKARLDALLAKAEAAARSAHWDEAIQTLTALLSEKPDAAVEAKLAEVRAKKREATLSEIRTRAQELARAERFDEALAAWDEYLALEPDDRESVEEIIQNTHNRARLANEYNEAQQAIRDKHYARAVELLQRIIAQDPAYKATTRLLVEAVESNKAIPVWRRPWVLPAVGVVVVLLLGVLVGPRMWENISTALARTPVATEGPSQTTAVSGPAQAFTDPILAYIANTSPSFEEDFSAPKDYWNSTRVDLDTVADRISDGIFHFSEKNGGEGFVIEQLQGKDFVLEFDYVLNSDDQNSHLIVDYRLGAGGSEVIKFNPYSFGLQAGSGNNIVNEVVMIPPDRTYHFQMLAQENRFAIYINNELITYSEEATLAYGGEISFGVYAEAGFDGSLDNIKFWNLEGVEISPTEPALDPAIEIALAAIQNEAPTYQTSFDAWDFGDPVENVKVENGKLIVASINQQHAGVDIHNISSDKFAVEFDLRILESSSEGHCIFETQNDGTGESWRAISAMFFLNGSAGMAHYVHPDQFSELVMTENRFDFSKSNAVRLIFLGGKIAALVNGQLAYSALDPDGSAVYTFQALSANYTVGCEFDNYKFWDLSRVDFSTSVPTAPPTLGAAASPPTATAALLPTTTPLPWVTDFAEPVLAAIKDREADFQDDFATAGNGWYYEGASSMSTEGLLRIWTKKNSAFVENDNLNHPNFVLQVDCLSKNLQIWIHGNESGHYWLSLQKSLWYTGGDNNPGGNYGPIYGSVQRVLIIKRGSRLGIFLNGTPLSYFDDPVLDKPLFQKRFECTEWLSVCEFDNVKFWNLDNIPDLP